MLAGCPGWLGAGWLGGWLVTDCRPVLAAQRARRACTLQLTCTTGTGTVCPVEETAAAAEQPELSSESAVSSADSLIGVEVSTVEGGVKVASR